MMKTVAWFCRSIIVVSTLSLSNGALAETRRAQIDILSTPIIEEGSLLACRVDLVFSEREANGKVLWVSSRVLRNLRTQLMFMTGSRSHPSGEVKLDSRMKLTDGWIRFNINDPIAINPLNSDKSNSFFAEGVGPDLAVGIVKAFTAGTRIQAGVTTLRPSSKLVFSGRTVEAREESEEFSDCMKELTSRAIFPSQGK
jgi:hypothetical protein